MGAKGDVYMCVFETLRILRARIHTWYCVFVVSFVQDVLTISGELRTDWFALRHHTAAAS